MTLGESIQNLRKANDLSQEQLAGLLHVSRQSISKWESDISIPEFDKLKSLCGIFHVSMDELVYGKAHEEQAALEEKVAFLQDCILELQMKKPISDRVKSFFMIGAVVLILSVLMLYSRVNNLRYEVENLRAQVNSFQSMTAEPITSDTYEADFQYKNLDVDTMKVDQTTRITLYERKKDTKLWFVYKIGDETKSVEAEEVEDMVYEITQKLPLEENVKITIKQESDGIKTSEVVFDTNVMNECENLISIDTKSSSTIKKDGKEYVKVKAYFLKSLYDDAGDNEKGILSLKINEYEEQIGEYKLPKESEKNGIFYYVLDIEIPIHKMKGKAFQLSYHEDSGANDFVTKTSYKYKDGKLQ